MTYHIDSRLESCIENSYYAFHDGEPVEGGDERLLRKDTDRIGQENNMKGELNEDNNN